MPESPRECYSCGKAIPNQPGIYFCPGTDCHSKWLNENPNYAAGSMKFRTHRNFVKGGDGIEKPNEK